MKIFTQLRTLLPLVLLSAIFVAALVAPAPQSYAAEQTTWQKFIQQKCGSSSADAAEQCAQNLEKELKERCGAPRRNDTYTTCWRKFIRDNRGTAPADSSPFEEEIPVDTGSPQSCGGVSTNIIPCSNSAGDPVSSLILDIINFLAVGVGIAVVGGIIWGGMMYASSNGDSAKTKQAVSIIVNAVIGLLLFIFMYAILNYIVPGGLFT